MRVLIFGSRTYAKLYTRYKSVEEREADLRNRVWPQQMLMFNMMAREPFDVLIQGEAQGADLKSKELAQFLDFKVKVIPFRARWDVYGRAAGPIRNREMLVSGLPDRAMGFIDGDQITPGSKNMHQQLLNNKIPVELFSDYSGVEIWNLPHKT